MAETLLDIKNLHANVGVADVEILKGLNLSVGRGEVHAIMGPNGSGKSTLAYVLAGHPSYVVTEGDVLLDGESILGLAAEERARAGIFLSFQNPVEVPGVRLSEFLRAGYNSVRKARGEEELSARRFNQMLREKAELVEMDPTLIQRSVNEGFSGGERKRNEILQMAILEPKLAILDEPDSGLDVDAVRIVANGIEQLRSPDRSIVLITHYQRILNYVVPDFVHVIVDGRIVKSGGKDLALEVEAVGYEKYEEELEKSLPG
jgi:Fe-S cluster assembly ATP-binding protein